MKSIIDSSIYFTEQKARNSREILIFSKNDKYLGMIRKIKDDGGLQFPIQILSFVDELTPLKVVFEFYPQDLPKKAKSFYAAKCMAEGWFKCDANKK